MQLKVLRLLSGVKACTKNVSSLVPSLQSCMALSAFCQYTVGRVQGQHTQALVALFHRAGKSCLSEAFGLSYLGCVGSIVSLSCVTQGSSPCTGCFMSTFVLEIKLYISLLLCIQYVYLSCALDASPLCSLPVSVDVLPPKTCLPCFPSPDEAMFWLFGRHCGHVNQYSPALLPIWLSTSMLWQRCSSMSAFCRPLPNLVWVIPGCNSALPTHCISYILIRQCPYKHITIICWMGDMVMQAGHSQLFSLHACGCAAADTKVLATPVPQCCCHQS